MEKKLSRLYSDGACRGNPGVGGAGAVITDAEGSVIWEGKEYLGHCTNNIAEYKALILGLKGALAEGYKNLDFSFLYFLFSILNKFFMQYKNILKNFN